MESTDPEESPSVDEHGHWSIYRASPLVTMGVGVVLGALASAGQSSRVAMIVAAVGIVMSIAGIAFGYHSDADRSRAKPDD
ncbi:hypothetical protein [Stratiformator vulcanicus]|uniref:Uncharacterized protein n=1 Tax=Stratiformator vulcanicus TaxID=2527980 RepID=A0A517R7Q4_9PLAN|nr:hypothetical protein [Stratiformator vulcanicus]QDT39920.1 hypothetical protein Pan189_43320 [Stratiformator vulcanicus]